MLRVPMRVRTLRALWASTSDDLGIFRHLRDLNVLAVPPVSLLLRVYCRTFAFCVLSVRRVMLVNVSCECGV